MELESNRESSGKITKENRYSSASVDSGLPLSMASLNDSGSSLDSVKEANTRTAGKLEKSASVDTAAIHSLCSRMEQAVQLLRSYRRSSSAMIEDKSSVHSSELKEKSSELCECEEPQCIQITSAYSLVLNTISKSIEEFVTNRKKLSLDNNDTV